MPRARLQRSVGPSKEEETEGKYCPHPFLDPLHRLMLSPLQVAAAGRKGRKKVHPPVVVTVAVAVGE